MAIQIPHNFIARPYQERLYNSLANGKKRGVCVWHRRSGKDKTLLNLTIKECFKRVGAYYYFFPTYKQGKKIIWNGMDRDGFPFMNHFPPGVVARKNETDMMVELTNGSLFQIVGTDNIDSIVGTNPVGCVFSEYSLQDPKAWDFIRPILRENGGWALFNFTPRGYNHGHDIYQLARTNPDWFAELLTVKDTKVLSDADIEQERKDGMTEDMIQQEFFCSFDSALPGAYYSHELRLAREQQRITRVPYQSGFPVDTWWDLGIDDSTSIWFTQSIGREIRVLRYFESSGEGLEFYASELDRYRSKLRCLYGRHVAPHDITVREIGTGKTRLETAKNLGLDFEVCIRPAAKEDGIQAVRDIFSILCFDEEGCRLGLNGLASYRAEWDEKNRVKKRSPVHDWASHPADALQTLALAHEFTTLKKGGGMQPAAPMFARRR